jgi:hypothetical protein
MGWVANDTSRPLFPRERPGIHCIGGWVSLRADLERRGKSRPTGTRSPDRPALSESLYRLSYPGSCHRRHQGKIRCDIKEIFKRVNENEKNSSTFDSPITYLTHSCHHIRNKDKWGSGGVCPLILARDGNLTTDPYSSSA